jgi:hypothetical protein
LWAAVLWLYDNLSLSKLQGGKMDSPEELKPKHSGAAFIAQRIAEIAHELPELDIRQF